MRGAGPNDPFSNQGPEHSKKRRRKMLIKKPITFDTKLLYTVIGYQTSPGSSNFREWNPGMLGFLLAC